MSRGDRRRGEDRRFTVEAVPRSQPDLHKLAQVFLGMAVSRSKTNDAPTPGCFGAVGVRGVRDGELLDLDAAQRTC